MGRAKVRGYTLIEVVIVIAIIAILTSIVLAAWSDHAESREEQKRTREVLERESANDGVRCIGGYKFATQTNGNSIQILNDEGKGIKCE